LLAVAEHEKVDNDLIPRIATGFCSGLSRTGGLCGAVSGAIMAVGMVLGRSVPGGEVDACYSAVQAFIGRFYNQFSALSCLELTGVHLGTPEGQAAFKEKGQVHACTEYVSEATRMVIEILRVHDR
jgi:C_GCAxxG_C_C family probable redox protein